jgi:hypothetical protein
MHATLSTAAAVLGVLVLIVLNIELMPFKEEVFGDFYFL